MENSDDPNGGGDLPAIHFVPFHDDTLVTLERGGTHYVAMRRVVENMGMAWQPQHAKLSGQTAKFSCHDIVTAGADGKRHPMLCMPVEKLALWLATVNPNKVRADLRPKVERYQAESAIALHDYWTKGSASRDGGDVASLRVLVIELATEVRDLRAIQDHRRAAVTHVSVRVLLDEAGALAKGRNSVNRKIGRALKDRALFITSQGEAAPCLKDANTEAWLWKREFADRYMREVGNSLVALHNDKVTGQGVIRFPDRREKLQGGSGSEGAPANP